MGALDTFAKLLGLPRHQAEDALHSERAAKAVLSRRSFFAAGAALAAGTVYAPSCELYVNPWAEAQEFMMNYEDMFDAMGRVMGAIGRRPKEAPRSAGTWIPKDFSLAEWSKSIP